MGQRAPLVQLLGVVCAHQLSMKGNADGFPRMVARVESLPLPSLHRNMVSLEEAGHVIKAVMQLEDTKDSNKNSLQVHQVCLTWAVSTQPLNKQQDQVGFSQDQVGFNRVCRVSRPRLWQRCSHHPKKLKVIDCWTLRVRFRCLRLQSIKSTSQSRRRCKPNRETSRRITS